MTRQDETRLTGAMYSILFANDVAQGAVYELVELLDGVPELIRFRVRQRRNILMRQMREYNKKLEKTRYIEFISDLNDRFGEELRPDLQKAYYTVHNRLSRFQMPYTDLLTKLVLASTLCFTAETNLERTVTYLQRAQVAYASRLKALSLTRVCDAMKLLQGEIEKAVSLMYPNHKCDPFSSKDVENAFVIIARKLTNYNLILDTVENNEK